MTGSSSEERQGAWEAVSLVLRIATVGLSLASAIMTATSTQCLSDDAGRPGGTVSYGDYPSFRYAALADLLSAVLQGVAICLEATGREKAAGAVELIDKLVLALTSTSMALLLAVDDVTSCGPPRSRGARRVCGQAGAFCGRVRGASFFSLAGAVSVSASIYIRRAPAVTVTERERRTGRATRRSPERDSQRGRSPQKKEEEELQTTSPPTRSSSPPSDCDGQQPQGPSPCPRPLPLPPSGYCTDIAPPWCRCPRMTIPCRCDNPELHNVFF